MPEGSIPRSRKTTNPDTTGSTARMRQLDREVDQEQALQVSAAGLGFVGAILSVTINPAFALLPALAFATLGQYALQGWCPPVALLARLGIRSCKEIDRERYALAASIEEPAMPDASRAGAD
ncbi:MAG: hypothetical protein ACLQJR_00990 [Stellaceae bacterium]